MSRKMKDSGIEWIGLIPEDWKTVKSKYIYSNNDGGVWGEFCDVNDGYIVLRSTEQKIDGTLSIENPAICIIKETEFAKSKLIEGDLLITKSSGSNLHIGKTSYITKEVENSNCCFSNFMQRIRLRSNSHSKYYYYVFNSILVRNQFDYFSTTTSGLNNINSKMLNELWLVNPSNKEQQKIGRFLDNKVSEINHILEKTRESIEEYKMYRQSIISEAVTKGLNPNVEMKDSGIEWNKHIPIHWEVINGNRLFTERKEKGLEGDKQLTASQKHGIIYQEDFMLYENQKVVLVEKDFGILKHVEPNDFVISMRSFQGGLEYSQLQGCISSAYVMIIPSQRVYGPYFRWVFKSSKYINALQSTTNLVRDGQAMRFSNFKQVPLFIFPMEEQKQIADYLNSVCTEIDSLISQKENLLKDLELYKKSLIYECVTGKREVM